jgi:hypothetical protein
VEVLLGIAVPDPMAYGGSPCNKVETDDWKLTNEKVVNELLGTPTEVVRGGIGE